MKQVTSFTPTKNASAVAIKRKTTMTSEALPAEEQLWPTPRYAQEIVFEGRGCIAIAPEEYAALFNEHQVLTSRLASVTKERDELKGVLSTFVARDWHRGTLLLDIEDKMIIDSALSQGGKQS
jgi:hypothetical protein